MYSQVISSVLVDVARLWILQGIGSIGTVLTLSIQLISLILMKHNLSPS